MVFNQSDYSKRKASIRVDVEDCLLLPSEQLFDVQMEVHTMIFYPYHHSIAI